MKDKKYTLLYIVNAVTFAAMVAVNALANILPINNIGTGTVSDSYPNLFAPAGITFSIWGVIYLLLLLFVLYSFGAFKGKGGHSTDAVHRIKMCFALSSVANTAWIFAWHYQKIGISLILMLAIFASLTLAYVRINSKALTKKERAFVRVPFSVYYGWITIALIANVTTYLVSIGWNGFSIAQPIWMIAVVIVGLLITGTVIIKFKDVSYALVAIWAYVGILIKHTSASGFGGAYTGVIIAVSAALAALAAAAMIAANKTFKRKANQ
ncbi:MAG: tryptophan-rich sensory protein [Clostridia bacterium]|nr:tryptophan-rich sensory protein [Clostridia bacterium]